MKEQENEILRNEEVEVHLEPEPQLQMATDIEEQLACTRTICVKMVTDHETITPGSLVFEKPDLTAPLSEPRKGTKPALEDLSDIKSEPQKSLHGFMALFMALLEEASTKEEELLPREEAFYVFSWDNFWTGNTSTNVLSRRDVSHLLPLKPTASLDPPSYSFLPRKSLHQRFAETTLQAPVPETAGHTDDQLLLNHDDEMSSFPPNLLSEALRIG